MDRAKLEFADAPKEFGMGDELLAADTWDRRWIEAALIGPLEL